MRLVKGGLFACAAVAAVTLMALSVHAQSRTVKAQIPFAFHVGNAVMPAGAYMLEMRGDSLRINDGNGHAAAVLCNSTRNRDIDAPSRLIFKGSDTTWFLSEVRFQEYGNARQVIQSPSAEIELAKVTTGQRVVASVTR